MVTKATGFFSIKYFVEQSHDMNIQVSVTLKFEYQILISEKSNNPGKTWR